MGDVVRLVVGRGARLIAFGLVVGIAGGLAAGRYLESMPRGGSPYDVVSTITVVGLLACTGLAASWLPARRASKIPPMDALRTE